MEAAEAFRRQAEGCAEMGSAVYAELLARAADDIGGGGVFAEIVAGFPGHPLLRALPLRVAGALHALALGGEAPALAAHYPSCGGAFAPAAAWTAFRETARRHAGAIRARLDGDVQTNEVRRSAPLLAGYLALARALGLPLRLREIGASAGLNLLFDRWRYALGPHCWGDPAAPLAIESEWRGPPPPLDAPLRVASRAGCDVAPIDVRDDAAALRLASFVWPDQTERLARLRAAIAAARRDPPRLERARAGDWVPRELATLPRGEASVLVQTWMWWYLPEAEREAVTAAVREAGARATPEAPLLWLRLEGAKVQEAELRVWRWPGDEDHLLARAHHHGAWVSTEGCDSLHRRPG